MEEIKFDLFSMMNPSEMEYFNQIMERSKKYGVQTGITWSSDVYKYLFEDSDPRNFADILGFDTKIEEL